MHVRSALLLTACAALLLAPRAARAQTSSDSQLPVTTPSVELRGGHRPHADRNLITAEDVATRSTANAYELVQALHPQWLRGRGQTSLYLSGGVKVYRDGQPIGGVDALRQITGASIGEIRFVDGTDAVQRWGADHGAGAILVTTR